MVTEQEGRTRAEALVRAYCGWRVAPLKREVLAVHVAMGREAALLPTMHLSALHSVTVAGQVLDASTYTWSSTGVVRPGDTVPFWGYGALDEPYQLAVFEADVTHGHEDWPPELLGVLDALTSRAQQAPSMYVQVGQVRVATGQDGMPVGSGLTAADRAVLDRYRLPPRP